MDCHTREPAHPHSLTRAFAVRTHEDEGSDQKSDIYGPIGWLGTV